MTQRIPALDLANASPAAKALTDGVQAKIGRVPNIYKTMAHAPAALEAALNFGAAMSKASLPAALREQIALAVAGANGCDYCASAHTAIGKNAGLSDDAAHAALNGSAPDAKVQAILTFALAVNNKRGHVADADLQACRAAGCTDQELIEIVAVVCQNIFTNYINHLQNTEIDFPAISTGSVKKAA